LIFFLPAIADRKRKAIFAKPFEKRISEGLFLKNLLKNRVKLGF
jgi:hypothetical protein